MMMRKSICKAWALAICFGAIVVFGGVKEISAQVNVGVNFDLGSAPPEEVVMVPGGVYFVPTQNADVFFYNGYWWGTLDNYWYRSNDYNGKWKVVEGRNVPAAVRQIYVVPNYRQVYVNQDGKRMPYGQWKKNGYRAIMVQENHDQQGERGDQGNQKGNSGKKNKQGHGK